MSVSARVELDLPASEAELLALAPSAWYRPESLAGLPNGAQVAQWDDDSGNGRHLAQSVAGLKPLVVHGVVNGWPAIRFDGSDDVLEGNGFTVGSLVSEGDGTVFVVFWMDVEAADYVTLWQGAGGGNGIGQFLINPPGGQSDMVSVNYDGSDSTLVNKAAAAGVWHVGCWRHAPFFTTWLLTAAVDDQDDAAQVGVASLETDPVILAGTNVKVGGGVFGFAPLNGFIAELMFFPTTLTEEQRRVVSKYLVRKFGIVDTTTAPANSWVDVSSDVLSGVRASWGMSGGGPKDRVADIGTLRFDLDNSSQNAVGVQRYYSPGDPSACVGFGVGTGVRLVMSHPLFGERVKWRGTVFSADPSPTPRVPVTKVSCVDWMHEASRAKPTGLSVMVDAQADEVFDALVACVTRQPDATRKVPGGDVYPFALDNLTDEGSSILGEFQKLAMSEYGLIYDEAGTATMEGRRGRAGAGSSLFHLDDDVIEEISLSHDRDDVVNRVQVVTHPRRRDTAATTVLFTLESSMFVPRATSVEVDAQYRDPSQLAERTGGMDMVAPVGGTDYHFDSAEDGTGDDLTAQLTVDAQFDGNTAKVVVTNNGPFDGYLVKDGSVPALQLRGRGLYDFSAVTSDQRDASSAALYGETAMTYDMPYQSAPETGFDMAFFLLGLNRREATRVSSVTFYGNWSDEAMQQVLERRISDRVSVSCAQAGVAARQYFINGVSLDVSQSMVVRCTWRLAPVDTAQFWLLEVPGRTELDLTTTLGYGLFVPGWVLDDSELGTETFLN